MRILVLSQYFWPESFRINELVSALHAKDVDVEVLTGQPNYPSGVIFEGYRSWGCGCEPFQGMTVRRVPLVPRGNSRYQLSLNYLSFIVSAFVFGTWLLRKRQFDAVFIFGASPILVAIPGIWFGWLKRCPTLLWVQDLWPESLSATGYLTHPASLKALGHAIRWIYQKVDMLLVQSRAFIPKVRDLSGSTPIIYYPNSFMEEDSGEISQSVPCQELEGGFPVVFAGNMGSAQALEVVLEAAALLRNFEGIRFVMVGDGSQREWLMQQAMSQCLENIVFPGRYPIEAMPALMAKAGALLVTLADTEIFRLTIPSKIQAYLAAGRPIIACLNGAGADIVSEAGAGITVPAGDALALSEAIRTLYFMQESQRVELGKRGRTYYQEHFSHDKLVDKLIDYFEEAVRSHKRATK